MHKVLAEVGNPIHLQQPRQFGEESEFAK